MSEGLAQYYFRQIVVGCCAPFHAQPMLAAKNRAAGRHADGRTCMGQPGAPWEHTCTAACCAIELQIPSMLFLPAAGGPGGAALSKRGAR